MYNHQEIEKKWQQRWLKDNVWCIDSDKSHIPSVTHYILDMFPYPSGAGLHVGHPRGYTATDIYARYLRMKGVAVLHPMGWDAFGLPTENYAIKAGVTPREATEKNVATFRRQLQSLGLSYDWDREVNTSLPDYYKWTQWIFLFLYKHKLAYKKKAPVNWCNSCQTVLAREQVVNGVCDRCKNQVEQKELEQWFLRITDYAERLLEGLDTIDWPEQIKVMQRNWIGKSEGALIRFEIRNSKFGIEVFTTRPDTLYGATYLVLAPEHEFVYRAVQGNTSLQNTDQVRAYIENARKKSELERTQLQKEKTGVELKGFQAINPATGEEIPIWVADYVIASYGTGAIMAVPAHDERDFEFAKMYELPIMPVVVETGLTPSLQEAYTGIGAMINSGEFNGMDSEEAKWKITEKVGGKKIIQYRLRDWLISRQRYWGAPIPIMYCNECGEQSVPENQLPVILPTDVDFKPTGESPLARSREFQNNVQCPKCGGKARREMDTMDTFMCSSWYYLRFCDPHNTKEFVSPEIMKQWMPVDTYVGGAEHAVLHLMYARFVHKALYDYGMIPKEIGDEPFITLRNVGLVLAEDGRKMSKSLGNVINPDDVVQEYGADSVRMYEMFMGPFEDALPWQSRGIVGMRRFLERVYIQMSNVSGQLSNSEADSLEEAEENIRRVLHKTIKKVTEDIQNMRFNTAISALMICLNQLTDISVQFSNEYIAIFVKLLFPFAPHLAQEMWTEVLHQEGYVDHQPWPEYDERCVQEETLTIAVQVNGKVRAQIEIEPDATEQDVIAQAQSQENVKKWIAGKEIMKTLYVQGKIISIVTQ